MGKRSNFRTTVTSCLLSVLVALSGAISPAQADVPGLADGQYVCTTGELRASGDMSLAYSIWGGVVETGGSCVGAVVIPEGVTSIAYGAFAEQSVLTSITIPASVTAIGDSAFAYAESLMDVNFSGDAPTNVGEGVFDGIASGAKANISADATGFGTDATWNGLEIVRAASVPANGQYVCTTGELRASGDMSLAYTITNGVVTSGGSCAGAVVIPEGVTSIRYSAFENATLTSITIPASVTSIGEYAFAFTYALSSIIFAQGSQLASIDQAVFYTTTALTSISIPAGVTTIGEYAFEDSALIDFNFLGNAPTNVGEGVFDGIASGAKVNISADATGFGTDATWNGLVIVRAAPGLADGQYVCTTGELRASGNMSLAYTITNGVVTSGGSCAGAVVIPEGVTSIGQEAFFEAASLTSINIPSTVTTIGSSGLKRTGLTSITFAEGSQLTTIGESALAATSITSITIPEGVISIGEFAFNETTELSSIIFAGSQLTTIGEFAFFGARGLTSITIPASVTSIGDSAFGEATALTSITIPAGVTTIGEYAFENASALSSIIFAQGSQLTMIEAGTFYGATALTSITIPAGVTTIGEYAFENASALSSIIFAQGSQLTMIEAATFYGATALTSITIPAGVTTIGENAFWGNSSLVGVYFLGDAPATVAPGAFGSGAPSATAYILPGATGYALDSNQKWNGLNVAVLYSVTSTSKTAISSYAAKFPAGSSVVSQTGKTAIKKIVSKAGRDAKYTVTGVATKVLGVPDSKVKGLAKARAEKVKAYLIKLGIKKSNITVKIKILDSGMMPKTKILAKYLT